MQYRFFICKPSTRYMAAHALQQYRLHHYSLLKNTDCFLAFDVHRLCQLLRIASKENIRTSPIFKFRIVSEGRGIGSLPIICILTEYSLAQEVTDALSVCLEEEGLIIFDAEMNFFDAIAEISRRERQNIVTLRLAYLRYSSILRQRLNCAKEDISTSIYKLGDCLNMTDDGYLSPVIDTSISLMRGNLPDVANHLYSLISEIAYTHNEEVYCQNGCFIVKNKTTGYRLRFVLEGTGKSPMNLCWIENGEVKLELLHRRGVYYTRKAIEKLDGWANIEEEEEYIRSRLYLGETFFTRGEWRNPADRFVDSYKISSWMKKNALNVIYGHHPGKSHHEFSFSTYGDNAQTYATWNNSSGFSLDEEEAEPLLALVESVIPYYYNYYYDSFYVRREEIELILQRLKEVRAIVSRNPSDASLGEIAKRLLNSSFAWEEPCDGDVRLSDDEHKKNVLFSHRHKLIALYDFFEWWLKRQQYDYYFYGFYIIGP